MTKQNFESLLNWKLLSGSHEFPGPSGGTCINEAALVAAGFPYRSVSSAHDMPDCFSRVISAFAIGLNDGFRDADRQRLIPFVTRLAGTADSGEVEQKRVEYLVKSLVNNVIHRMMIRLKRPDLAQACADAVTMEECRKAAAAADDAARYAAAAAAAARYAAAAAAAAARYAADDAARYAAAAAAAAAARYAADDAARYAAAAAARYAADDEREFFVEWGLGALEGVLAIGRQAEPVETAIVVQRMDAIRACDRAMARA